MVLTQGKQEEKRARDARYYYFLCAIFLACGRAETLLVSLTLFKSCKFEDDL